MKQPPISKPNTDTDRKSPRGVRGILPAGLCLGLALMGVLLLWLNGCDTTRHYQTLSFFFDGVPLPPGMAPPPGSAEELAIAEAQAIEAARPKPVTYVYHTPYLDRNCFGCHDRQSGYQLDGNDPALCRSCHQNYFDPVPGDWVHGPVAQQMCAYCHEPHRSEHPAVLRDRQPDICFNCHDPQRLAEDPFHLANAADTACSTCHDPHAAGNRLLLADARTYQRRTRGARPRVTPHNDWTRETCTNCHDLTGSNRLMAEIDRQCIQCHDSIQQSPAFGKLHQAVTDGSCTTCHTAHRSPRPFLIRPTAEKICLDCHKSEELPAVPHQTMQRIDCLLCHTGHHAEQPSLLRPNVLDYFAADPFWNSVVSRPQPTEDQP